MDPDPVQGAPRLRAVCVVFIGNGVVNLLISQSGQSDGVCLGWLMTHTRLRTEVIPLSP